MPQDIAIVSKLFCLDAMRWIIKGKEFQEMFKTYMIYRGNMMIGPQKIRVDVFEFILSADILSYYLFQNTHCDNFY